MPRINLKRLTAQNFKSIGEEITIQFDELGQVSIIKGRNLDIKVQDDNQDTPTVVNNGSGKSTIIDAILFSLYGKTLCDISNRDIPNRSIGSTLRSFSRLEFSTGGKDYVSEAFLNFKGKADPTIGFTLKIGDEEPISKNTAQMRQLIEENVIGCSIELFKSSVVISQSSYLNFYQLTKAQKVSYIESLFKLDVFGELLKEVRADIRGDTIEYNSTTMSRANHAEQLHEMIVKSNSFEAEAKGRRDKAESAIKMKEKAISICEGDLASMPAPIDLVELQKRLIDYRQQAQEKQIFVSKCNAAISAIRSKKTELEKSAGKHKEVLGVLCQECFKKADDLLGLSNTKTAIEQCDLKFGQVSEAMALAADEGKSLQDKSGKLEKQISEARDKEHRREMTENQLVYLRKELDELKESAQHISDNENPFTGLIEKSKLKMQEYDSLINTASDSIKLRKFMEFVFNDKGAKNAILADLAKNINMLIRHYLDRLGANYAVTLDSSFNASFVTASGESPFESFSSGERQRVNLATMLAFRDLIVGNRLSSNLLVLDEILDSALDSSGVASIVQSVVSVMSNTGVKLMLISHNPAVENKLRGMGVHMSVITAVKQNNRTSYIVGD